MAGMGPPPKPPDQRRRVNHKVPGLVQLPSDGRHGAAPQWPLGTKPSGYELRMWADVWGYPQAVMWERLKVEREVAHYVRWTAKSEVGDLNAAKEARQLSDRLGLNPLAMLRLRWEVPADEVAQRRSEHPAGSSRQRLVAVDPQAVNG